MSTIRVVRDRVLIKLEEAREEQSKGGIIMPDSVKKIQTEGTVVAVGTGRPTDSGFQPLEVKVGDRVHFVSTMGVNITVDDVEYKILNEADIIAIVSEG